MESEGRLRMDSKLPTPHLCYQDKERPHYCWAPSEGPVEDEPLEATRTELAETDNAPAQRPLGFARTESTER